MQKEGILPKVRKFHKDTVMVEGEVKYHFHFVYEFPAGIFEKIEVIYLCKERKTSLVEDKFYKDYPRENRPNGYKVYSNRR